MADLFYDPVSKNDETLKKSTLTCSVQLRDTNQ